MHRLDGGVLYPMPFPIRNGQDAHSTKLLTDNQIKENIRNGQDAHSTSTSTFTKLLTENQINVKIYLLYFFYGGFNTPPPTRVLKIVWGYKTGSGFLKAIHKQFSLLPSST
ncbi:MAG: hypothetical protein F6K39_19870 [Okeania sp. SIO3B3]|nr:hypothetical protein [Okeania sp. SIO3B3]